MKTLIFISVVLLMTSCDVVIITPNFDQRNQIVGTYQVDEYSDTYNSNYHYFITVSKVGVGNDIYLENIYDAGIAVRAQFVGNQVYIPWQVVNGYEIEGAGTLYGGHLTINYTARDQFGDWGGKDFCKSDAWKE